MAHWRVRAWQRRRSRRTLRDPLDELLTERAARVVARAGREAAARGRTAGPGDLVLALAGAEDGVGMRALGAMGVSRETVREHAEAWPGDSGAAGPGSRDMGAVLETARREAAAFGHRHVGTEHLLLALIREACLPWDLDAARGRVLEVLRGQV